MPTSSTTNTIDFFLDPVCPWAWITSRWLVEVASQRDLAITWRFICLSMVNEDRYGSDTHLTERHVALHGLGRRLLRVGAAIRSGEGNAALGEWYGALGAAYHAGAGGPDVAEPGAMAALLTGLGHSEARAADLAVAAADEVWDTSLREDTELALERAGADVGTPVVTFDPPGGPSFFGPVLSRIPRGAEALALFDHVAALARTRGFAELKRSIRDPRSFA